MINPFPHSSISYEVFADMQSDSYTGIVNKVKIDDILYIFSHFESRIQNDIQPYQEEIKRLENHIDTLESRLDEETEYRRELIEQLAIIEEILQR